MNAPVHNCIVSIYSLGSNKKQQSWDGRGARSAPFGTAMSPKGARTRGQTPLVIHRHAAK
jgi:hypothetical protein